MAGNIEVTSFVATARVNYSFKLADQNDTTKYATDTGTVGNEISYSGNALTYGNIYRKTITANQGQNILTWDNNSWNASPWDEETVDIDTATYALYIYNHSTSDVNIYWYVTASLAANTQVDSLGDGITLYPGAASSFISASNLGIGDLYVYAAAGAGGESATADICIFGY